MKTAGVVIDAWKLPVFRRHLDTAKRDYTEHPGITADTLTLKVKYEWVHELQPVIEAANAECAQIKARAADKTTGEQREALINRFLGWPLPASVCSDLCATDRAYKFPRSGTNLLTADEARQMLDYLLGPL